MCAYLCPLFNARSENKPPPHFCTYDDDEAARLALKRVNRAAGIQGGGGFLQLWRF